MLIVKLLFFFFFKKNFKEELKRYKIKFYINKGK